MDGKITYDQGEAGEKSRDVPSWVGCAADAARRTAATAAARTGLKQAIAEPLNAAAVGALSPAAAAAVAAAAPLLALVLVMVIGPCGALGDARVPGQHLGEGGHGW